MYLPTGAIRPDRVSTAKGPAIVLPMLQSPAMLVTGGDPGLAFFLDGPHAGASMQLDNSGNFKGLIVEDVRFEVDLSSEFRPALVDQPIGAIVRTQRGLEIMVVQRNGHGFDDMIRVSLDGSPDGADRDIEVGYSRWKAFIGEGVGAREIYAFELARKGNF